MNAMYGFVVGIIQTILVFFGVASESPVALDQMRTESTPVAQRQMGEALPGTDTKKAYKPHTEPFVDIPASITNIEQQAGYYHVDRGQRKTGTPDAWRSLGMSSRTVWFDPLRYDPYDDRWPPIDVSPHSGIVPLSITVIPAFPGLADDWGFIDFGDGATSSVECAEWRPETDYCERMQRKSHLYEYPGTYVVRNPLTTEPPVEVTVQSTIMGGTIGSITDAEREAGYYYANRGEKKAGTPDKWNVFEKWERLIWYDPTKYFTDRLANLPPPDVSPLSGKAPLTVLLTPLTMGADDGPWPVDFGDSPDHIFVECAEAWKPEMDFCPRMKKIEHTYTKPGTYLVRELDRPAARIIVQ